MTDPAGPEREIEALRARQGTLRLVSPHPDYPADEVHVVGKVLWKVTRACPRPVPDTDPRAGGAPCPAPAREFRRRTVELRFHGIPPRM